MDKEFILSQINGTQKAKNKLPEYYHTPNIIYPSKLSMEQCSSEKTGLYKSKIIKGESLIDLTGGFGIDSFYFSKEFKTIIHIEQNTLLSELAEKNFKLLKANNIESINATAEEFIDSTNIKADFIYIDPSRRNVNERVFKLDDCTPNIIDLAPEIFKIADQILIKTAPLLDIKQTIKDLKKVSEIWVISVDNDCKEVLYLIDKNNTSAPEINTINLTKNNQEFSFNYENEINSSVSYSLPEKYLYEPNSAILKAGAFNSVSDKYRIDKIAPNSHLYTSESKVENFPGRIFKIEKTIPYSTKEFKKIGLKKANISCRNFKETVEQTKKKIKLKDGGNHYVFATTDINNKPILIICVK
ncbi:class I SAM-dependent methyltransferase [Vicingaceae bacterium]|nr:class I SAM-dependent methyltransferase [Vicingaceae bacterium]